MPHTVSRLLLFFIITLFLSSICLAQDDPRTLALVEKLMTAGVEEQRAALLVAEKELVTVGLRKSLIVQGKQQEISGKYQVAFEHYNLAKRVAEQINDQAGLAESLSSISYIHYLQGRYQEALETVRQALSIGEALGDEEQISFALRGAGLIYTWQGDFNLALEYYRRALSLNDTQTNKLRAAQISNNVGNVYYWQGNFPLALEYFQKGLRAAEELKSKRGIVITLSNISNVYFWQGNYSLAMENYRKALSLAEELGDKKVVAHNLGNIGYIHEAQANYDVALEFYSKSLAQLESLGDQSAASNMLTTIGTVYLAQGQHRLALEYTKKSLALHEKLGLKKGIADVLNNIGAVYQAQGDRSLAREFYEKSLTLAGEIEDRSGTANALNKLASLHQTQGDQSSALSLAERAATIALEIGDRESYKDARTTAGRAYRALDRVDEARESFTGAIATIEALRAQVSGGEQEQQRFFENKVAPYHAMVELLIAQNKPDEAFAYAERGKSRVLLDVLQSGRVNINKAMTMPEQEQERRLKSMSVSFNTQITRENSRPQPDKAKLADLKVRLQKSRLDHEAFESGLYAAHPELKTRRGVTQPATLEELAALLPDARSALAQYVVTDDKTFLFVLTPSGAKTSKPIDLNVFTLDVKRKDLAARVGRFREQLARRDVRFAASARELHALLLAPAHRELQGKRTLVIVPDAALWELPFQALQPAANRFLIEDHAVSYAPSLTVLREMKRARRKNPRGAPTSAATLLAFGNPTLGKPTMERVKSVLMDGELNPLPEAEKQVQALGRLYGATNSRVYTGAQAREERVKAEAGNYKILQLVTHGILNDASPMYSHVMLAQNNDGADKSSAEDGLLEAWEMMNLDLNADLVVLSACETARGRVGAGEGVIGLTWALFVAGSPTTVVSQWKVESASTTELMLEFHRQLQSKIKTRQANISTAKALQSSALKMLRSNVYRHPFYWAGFVIVGDGS